MSGPELFEAGLKLVNGMQPYRPDWSPANPMHNAVTFPESVFEGINVDMDFLVDMNTTQISTGQVARIIEAKGQFRGRIDRKGALVVEAVGMRAVMESCGPRGEALVIDDAFLAVFEKTGVGPVSVLFVAEDCWTVADGPVVTPTEPSHDEAQSDSGGESEAYRPE